MANLVVREATLADRDAILVDISANIYDGWDYIPSCYQQWLHDPDYTMFCVEDTNTKEIVGFEVIGIHDCGRTLVFHALRVLEARRGQGVVKVLGKEMHRRAQEDYPNALRVRSVVQDKNQRVVRMHEKLGYRRVSLTPLRFGKILKPLPESQFEKEPLNVTRMSAAELCRCLDAMPEAKRLKLIPANIVLTDWIPHEACLDEFAAIERKDGALFTTVMAGDEVKGLCISHYCSKSRGLTLCCSICCHGNGDVLRELFIHALLRNAFGCNHVFLSYDLSLRRDLEPYEDPEQRDLRLPAPLQRLQEELRDHVDFSIDTIGSSQQLLELPLKRE